MWIINSEKKTLACELRAQPYRQTRHLAQLFETQTQQKIEIAIMAAINHDIYNCLPAYE